MNRILTDYRDVLFELAVFAIGILMVVGFVFIFCDYSGICDEKCYSEVEAAEMGLYGPINSEGELCNK